MEIFGPADLSTFLLKVSPHLSTESVLSMQADWPFFFSALKVSPHLPVAHFWKFQADCPFFCGSASAVHIVRWIPFGAEYVDHAISVSILKVGPPRSLPSSRGAERRSDLLGTHEFIEIGDQRHRVVGPMGACYASQFDPGEWVSALAMTNL